MIDRNNLRVRSYDFILDFVVTMDTSAVREVAGAGVKICATAKSFFCY